MVLPASLLAGCVLGPTALSESRWRYNEVISKTSNEQILLNLVRLRYRDVPFVLDVGSVSAQFEFRQSTDALGTLNENVGPYPINPDSLEIGGGFSFADRPTVIFSPVQGQKFVRQLMTPVGLDTLLLLQRSGWRADRVLRLCVQSINGVDNATSASGPTPRNAPAYREFRRVCQLIQTLQDRRQIAFGYVSEDSDFSDAIPPAAIQGEDLVLAAKEGFTLRKSEDGTGFVLRGPKSRIELQIAELAADSPEVRELIDILNLAPGKNRFEVVFIGTEVVNREPNPPGFQRVFIASRALLGTMFYVSQNVDIPKAHERGGLVTQTRTEDGQPFDWNAVSGDLLRIQSQRLQPRNAAVAVQYRGYWFYIADDDLASKSTFTLLSQLGSLQAGVEAGPGPVLTIPVGG
ncbi:MAG: hypothetical protein AMXMBFR20_05490 [Planctomycetia bacterium]|jgi:hypothetical protein|nr:MAG: hypothetical protein B6D36_08845 [Planctomycetes bacterium UTPLA1]